MSEDSSTPPRTSESTGAPSPPPPGIRASDEDRERVIAELHDHAVAGRLTTDELEERLAAAYSARTTSELDGLRRDLPAARSQTAPTDRERRSHLTRRMIQETGGSFGLFIICTAVWVASGADGQFWPVWVLLVAVLSLARSGWALVGPAPDLDGLEAQLESRRQRRIERDQRRSRRRP
jgi:hypothetical protein